MPVLLDFESRSRTPLKNVGGRNYWAHPSTEALCCAWHDTRDGARGVWFPGDEWPHQGRVLAAHNAKHFDRFGADAYDFAAANWVDTSDLARKSGLPGSLEVLGYPKDKAASRFTVGLSTVRRPPKSAGDACISAEDWRALGDKDRRRLGVQAALTVDSLMRVVEYCERDVEVMVRAWPELSEFAEVDADACAVDLAINERGVYFDRELARAMLRADATRSERVIECAADEFGVDVQTMRAIAIRPAEITALLGTLDATKATLDAFASHPVVRARRALASIVRGKLEAGLTRVSPDGRLRDTHQYYGGHTGRWSGRGFQPHNLTRPWGGYKDWTDDLIDALAENVINGYRLPTTKQSDLLLRACLRAAPGKRLVVRDFSGVEARATGWAARDENTLAVFTSGRDPYKAAAVDIYGVAYGDVTTAQRQIGKIAVLALGYQGGPAAFAKFAEGYGIDFGELDIEGIVAAWRKAHSATVSLWYACQRAFIRAAGGASAWAGPFQFVPSSDGEDVAAFLPSGRPVVYRDARILHDETGRATCTHSGQVSLGHWGTVYTYGGKLVENLIQAMCRDYLAEVLVDTERDGLDPVLHVHDECVCEVDTAAVGDAEDYLHSRMTAPPKWAPDFPAAASGFVGIRYRK